LLIEIQRAMMAGAQKIIVCLDHTKFGRRSVTPLSTLEPIDIVVTDSAAPTDLVDAIRAAGVEVIVAPPAT
jgi:DeoR/GlpR family transcriptional regulator of sugar metabolism